MKWRVRILKKGKWHLIASFSLKADAFWYANQVADSGNYFGVFKGGKLIEKF